MPKETLLKEYTNLLIHELRVSRKFTEKWKKLSGLGYGKNNQADSSWHDRSRKNKDGESYHIGYDLDEKTTRSAMALKKAWLAGLEDPKFITPREQAQAMRYLTSKLRGLSRGEINAELRLKLIKDLENGKHLH